MPKYTQPKKAWFYPVDFKIKAVQLSLRDDVLSKDVAQALDIHPFRLFRWRKEYREGKFNNNPCYQSNTELMIKVPTKKEINKIKQLQEVNKCLKQENSLLKCGKVKTNDFNKWYMTFNSLMINQGFNGAFLSIWVKWQVHIIR